MRRDPLGIRPGSPRGAAAIAGIGACLVASVVPARCAPVGSLQLPWVSVGLLSGSTRLDPALTDYQWDVTPRLDWGAEGLVGYGRWAGGARWWRTQAAQRIEGASPASANVRATRIEL